MKFACRVRLSTYRLLIKRGLTVERIRRTDFSGANFSWANFSGADFSGANFSWANFSGANFSRASLNIVGIGIQLKIGKYRVSFVGKYLSVGCVTKTIKQFAKGTEDNYKEHPEGLEYRAAIQRTIKAVFAMKRAARLK